ncbi:hypothetical protein APT56_06125 [Achromobacter denitrificans]|uniref:hypothetical protein n=1 Tax=Achromobacter ruhlandii TaxID=72557 RepID=UPI000742F77F|nr:hypothetical protein APT56_06125 [Achromobacter denitrificans]
MPTSHATLAAALSSPIISADDVETLEAFFKRPEVRAFYQDAEDPAHTEASLEFCAGLLPSLHPSRASALALMCGSLVEDGADPVLLFPALQALLRPWLQTLRPYCALEVEEDDTEVEEADRQAWNDAVARLEAIPRERRWELDAQVAAIDTLVLPMMAMLMRDQRNHRAFVADAELMDLLYAMTTLNDNLPFEQLHYLWLASRISYEDELVVVLPTSGTGFVARAHGINNNFHAFTLLQNLMRDHIQPLGVRREIAAREPDAERDSADFQWLQADAYAKGALVNDMRFAWGEAALRDNLAKGGKRVLIALEAEDGMQRNWSGFNGAIHDEQRPSMTFTRYLTPDEVAAYLA